MRYTDNLIQNDLRRLLCTLCVFFSLAYVQAIEKCIKKRTEEKNIKSENKGSD